MARLTKLKIDVVVRLHIAKRAVGRWGADLQLDCNIRCLRFPDESCHLEQFQLGEWLGLQLHRLTTENTTRLTDTSQPCRNITA